MLGLLLARAGVRVTVLEKHSDFLRDFRGDTVHPSTLELMHELGFLDEFLRCPHQKAPMLTMYVGDEEVPMADFSHLPVQCGYIALMPQWDFLNFLAERARRYPGFRLESDTEVIGLIEEGGRVVGLRAKRRPGGELLEVRAGLVVAADGRHSIVRKESGLEVLDIGAPMDVLWFRIPRHEHDPDMPSGRFISGKIIVMINRGSYWQCGFVIQKGTFESVRSEGIERFRSYVAEAAPYISDRVDQIRSWDEVKLLTVTVNRLKRWYREGLLCIGDAAHAMSPVGGVGINLAVQDAVAAANILAGPLRDGVPTEGQLRLVQHRRELPTKVTQRLQVFVQNRLIGPTLTPGAKMHLPFPLRMLRRFPVLRRVPARLIGLGIRPEHIN